MNARSATIAMVNRRRFRATWMSEPSLRNALRTMSGNAFSEGDFLIFAP
jgi:hypothetical protein